MVRSPAPARPGSPQAFFGFSLHQSERLLFLKLRAGRRDLAVISPHWKRVTDRRPDCLGAAGPCPGDPCFQMNPINRPAETMVGLLGAQPPPEQEGWSARWLEAPPSPPPRQLQLEYQSPHPTALGLGGQSSSHSLTFCSPEKGHFWEGLIAKHLFLRGHDSGQIKDVASAT